MASLICYQKSDKFVEDRRQRHRILCKQCNAAYRRKKHALESQEDHLQRLQKDAARKRQCILNETEDHRAARLEYHHKYHESSQKRILVRKKSNYVYDKDIILHQ